MAFFEPPGSHYCLVNAKFFVEKSNNGKDGLVHLSALRMLVAPVILNRDMMAIFPIPFVPTQVWSCHGVRSMEYGFFDQIDLHRPGASMDWANGNLQKSASASGCFPLTKYGTK